MVSVMSTVKVARLSELHPFWGISILASYTAFSPQLVAISAATIATPNTTLVIFRFSFDLSALLRPLRFLLVKTG